jgi:TRAP-type C4-dicarboxylate transport system substrate-binding protein
MVKMKKTFRTLLSALAISTSVMAAPAFAQEFRLLSSWDKNYAYNPYMLDPFIKGVQEGSKGRMKFVVNGPETVPPFEQLEPVSNGVFQFLFTHGSYHFGTTPALTIVEALQGDLAAVRKSGLYDLLDKHYQRYNLKIVMLPVSPPGAYNIILRQPIGPQGDLSGRKIRGTSTYAGVIKMLNGTNTVLPVGDVYTGLEKGLIDGSSWPIIGALDYKWNEVAKYLLRPGFGINYETIFMNLQAWNKLSPADQKLVSDVARRVEDGWARDARSAWKKEEDALLAKGMIVTEMGAAQKEKLAAAWSSGLLESGAAKDPKFTADLRKWAAEKGLLK